MKRIIYCNPDYDCRINWLIKELDLVKGSPTSFFAGSRETYKDLCRKCAERDVVPPLLITDDDDLVDKILMFCLLMIIIIIVILFLNTSEQRKTRLGLLQFWMIIICAKVIIA